ncbi:unnamed protein product [Clonostachys rosea f. rosea IK726]|uniref:TOG domain-containing protein n=2 Tax=Bionectria ochroleuca TaxID=29856 RepID=A0A0B7JM19_BIOOC|nr:unnamed protein product [Clonostachys rosea f. rosea IK726]
MADNKVTEEQAAELLTILHSDIILDKKVQFVTNIKSGIKQHNVPETCVPQLFDGLRAAASSQHNAIVNVGFTALNHLLTRLSRQEPKLLNKEAARTLPLIIEKLGDQKDKYRATAMQALNTLYSVNPGDVERFIRNSAMTGKNPRAKESAMQWLLQTHKEQGLQFRSYVPLLMDLLEDADGMVRDVAKSTVIELFRNAPNTAKSDLKRQLKNFKVRPAIEQAIVKELAPTGARPETPANAAPAARPVLAASVSSMSSERPITPAVDVRAENIEPQYVNTNRELDDIFKGMAWFFEGRESEQNWIKREESMVTLRRLNAGNATSDFPDTFLAGLRGMLDGIIKAVTSLRTSLSKEGCGLVQDIAVAFGPAMDPMVELLMQTFVKLSAGTKKISSQLANTTVDTILSNVTYSQRLMQHIWIACQDKNVAPRTYATGWLKTMLKKEAHHKSHVEHTGGVDLIEKCIKKGLGDPNPAVREKTRSVFWAFWGIWPQRADVIMEDLDATAQKLLNKDPSNPNAPKKEDAPPRPGLGLSRSTMTASKPSLRETMMAQKKAALATKTLPARPGSAMAHISHVRKVSDPKPPSGASSSKPSGSSRARPEAGTVSVNASSMSVAPMRPTRKRPEVAPRPATAGPYSVRDRGEHIEAESPRTLKAKLAPKPKETTPRRTAQRTRPGHASHASESSIASPVARPRSVASNRVSPTRLKNTQSALLSSSPAAKLNEDLTLVVPQIPHPEATTAQQANKVEEELVKPHVEALPETPIEAPVQIRSPSDETPQPVKVYEDPFVDSQQEPKPAFTGSVLEDKPVNEDAANLPHPNGQAKEADDVDSLDKANKNARLLDSGISKIKLKSLEVHGFRKLQSLLRDSKTVFTDDKFQALLLGLFQFLEDPLSTMPSDKAQDVKAQVLTTIKLLLKRERDNFKPHVSKCLESLLETRSRYEGRAHIISGLELLADELVTLGDPPEIVVVLGRKLQGWDDSTPEGCRALSTGLHVLKAMLEKQEEVVLSDSELALLVELTGRCLESTDSGVRMDAVQLCVALHACAGEERFWDSLKDIKEDPKSLITYYIIKRQRENGGVALA